MLGEPKGRSSTNTLILTGIPRNVLKDPEPFAKFLSTRQLLVELISLEKLQRIILICESDKVSQAVADFILSSAEWGSIKVSYSLRDNEFTLLDHDKWDADLQKENQYLELPAETSSRRFLVSPPLSPPPEWDLWSKTEEGPNKETIHSPEDIAHLLWERLGGLESSKVRKPILNGKDNESVNKSSRDVYESSVLFKDADHGVPLILLDPALNESLQSAKDHKSRVLGRTALPPKDEYY